MQRQVTKRRRTVASRRRLLPLMALKLFRHRTVHFLHRVPHVLASFLQVVEFLLLIRRQERTDLRHRFVEDRVSLLHRVFMNGDYLRPGLIEKRLHLGLLIGRQVQ